MPNSRRLFLKHSGILAIGTLLAGKPAINWAERLGEYFANDSFARIYAQLVTNQTVIDSKEIELSLPAIAEDGAVVPVTVSSELNNIQRIYLIADKNPTPLLIEFELTAGVLAFITARVKLAESCNVILLAKTDDQLLRISRWVKVVHGGCGTG